MAITCESCGASVLGVKCAYCGKAYVDRVIARVMVEALARHVRVSEHRAENNAASYFFVLFVLALMTALSFHYRPS